MRKALLFFSLILSTIGVFSIVKAQEQTLQQETIVSYLSNIAVNVDNSIDVVETITYNTGPQSHHGIYRDLYPYSSQNRKMSIENVTVTDENNISYQFQVSDSDNNFRIKIGDPNQIFTGQKIYIIKYHATKAVAQLKDLDEIYWNVTGNGWGMPIYNAHATIVLPVSTKILQSACYYGPKNSTNKCQPANGENGIYTFNLTPILNPYEGLTVAVGFSKGIVTPYLASDSVSNFFELYWRWFIAAILPLLTLIFSLLYWYKNGRDPHGTGVIIPQYDVPEGLTPMEVGGIVNEKVDTSDISAEIIYLATKGYIKINQLEERYIGFIKSADYELIKLKDYSDLPNDFDRKLLNGLFNTQPRTKISDFINLFKESSSVVPTPPQLAGSVKLSDLENVFYRDALSVVASVLDSLLNKGYYKNLGRMKTGGNRIFFIVFFSIWGSVFFGGMIGSVMGNPLPLMVGIFLSIVIYGVISYFSPAKTEKGVALKEYLLGMKDYLQIAEKDRLQFHNSPDKKPEVFEKLLPYAMVLGVANIWAKEFEGIYVTPPSWYSGTPSSTFSAIAFSNSISSFSTFAASSLSSTPNRSGGGGSGGGGFSGGGGGGGGGGSW